MKRVDFPKDKWGVIFEWWIIDLLSLALNGNVHELEFVQSFIRGGERDRQN